MYLQQDYEIAREIFKDFLLQNFKYDGDEEAAFDLWKVRCEMAPAHAARWLAGFDQVLQNPPPDLHDFLKEYGDIDIDSEMGCEDEYDPEIVSQKTREWLTRVFQRFYAYFQEKSRYDPRD